MQPSLKGSAIVRARFNPRADGRVETGWHFPADSPGNSLCRPGLLSFAAMLKQLLVTLLVAAIVIVFARMKRARRTAPAARDASSASSSPSAMVVAGYVLAAIMILATAGVTWMRYQEANEIVRVEVIDARSGERTVYQVRRKQLGERQFRTVDGRVVSLGASDRMERIE